MISRARTYSCSAVVRASEDLADQWVGHCLEFDIVAQGRTPFESFQHAAESTALAVYSDLLQGFDPTDRRAPDECWASFLEILREGTPAMLDGEDRDLIYAVQFAIVVPERVVAAAIPVLDATKPTAAVEPEVIVPRSGLGIKPHAMGAYC